ncbi:MAG: FAD-dependent oxidoreductase [Clostridia bacterium]|nr:FAD-dependent oxidoreductase [Clostridia bacterium]
MQKYDIITVGGGFAGTAAAIAAARRGRKVLLIEKYNCLGGAAMFALVQPFAGYRTVIDGKQKALSAGIFTEILDGVEAMGGLKFNRGYFNEEILKIVLQRMALKSGAELLFNTTVSGVQMDSHGIQSLTLCHVGGEERVSADYYIDATGDANLTYMAGYPFQLGRKEDNRCQPMTLCFRLANVKAEPESPVWREMQELYRKKQAEGKIRNPREDILWFQTLVPDIYHFNTTRIVGYNPTDVRELTRAETEAREQMFEVIELLKNNYEEFRDCIPISSGLQIGARESRMIAGEHTLTQEEREHIAVALHGGKPERKMCLLDGFLFKQPAALQAYPLFPTAESRGFHFPEIRFGQPKRFFHRNISGKRHDRIFGNVLLVTIAEQIFPREFFYVLRRAKNISAVIVAAERRPRKKIET